MARGNCTVCHATYPGGERFCPIDGGAIVDDDQTDPLIGKTIDGRYLVRRLIGRGGMGAVYEADHVGLDKRVAIKFMIEVDRDALARFRREARAASRITHEHVVQIFDVGTADEREFIAMEYLDGRDLRTAMQDGPLPPARATAIASQILHGLHAIHEAGIVHRDIKPGNILLVGDTDFVKIMDFGISTMDSGRGESVTRTGQVVGTPQFMAPEQLAGEEFDRRADVYAVGITLYAMLTGDVPFAGTSVAQIASQQQNGTVPTIDAKRFGTPEHVAAAVTRALAPSPSQRFATALDFADALGGVRESQASLATVNDRPRSRVPATDIVRRRSWRWLIVAAVLGFGATLAVVFAWPAKHVVQVARVADAAIAITTDDPLAAARTAERDGKLEVAVADYITLYDRVSDPEYLFRIGELYERMDRAPDAILYFKRYVERAPGAKDHDAVVAHIARLSPPPQTDAGVPDAAAVVAHKPVRGPASCACMPDDKARFSSNWLCFAKYPPMCRCQDAEHTDMCSVPYVNCPEPCAHFDLRVDGATYKCPTDSSHHRIRAKPNEACHGYWQSDLPSKFTERLVLAERDGTYDCDFCTPATGVEGRDNNFGFTGKTGEACKGIWMSTGEIIAGHLNCERPRPTR